MSEQVKRGLGRGLSSLISSPIAATDGGTVTSSSPDEQSSGMRFVSLTKIALNPYQPREEFDADELASLTDSVRAHGVLQPIVVRPKAGGTWELVAGERRFRAATAVGLKEIPAVVRLTDDKTALALALIENIQRENLNPIEAAKAYKRLQDDFHISQTEVAREVGKPQPTIANAIRLLNLPAPIIDSLAKSEITEGHGKAILSLDEEPQRIGLWHEVIQKKLNVRETERRASAIKKAPTDVIPRGMTPAPLLHHVALEEDISLALGAKTKIRIGANGKGTVEIGFLDADDLEGIVDRLLKR